MKASLVTLELPREEKRQQSDALAVAGQKEGQPELDLDDEPVDDAEEQDDEFPPLLIPTMRS